MPIVIPNGVHAHTHSDPVFLVRANRGFECECEFGIHN